MRSFFLLGSVVRLLPIHALDCSSESYLSAVTNSGGTKAVFHNHLYQAQWSVGNTPGNDMGWTDLGLCELLPPLPACGPTWNANAAYATAGTRVSYNGVNYQNKWYANPGATPDTPNGAWGELHPCGTDGPTPVPSKAPSAPAPGSSSTSTTTTTTTASSTTSTTTSSKAAVGAIEQRRPSGPMGPTGECVWPAWNPEIAYPSDWPYYVTHQGGVYSLKSASGPGREPGVDPSWSPKLSDCVGDPPATKFTEAELVAKIDPNGPKYQVFYDPWDPSTPTRDEMAVERDAARASLTEGQKRQLAAWKVLPTATIEACAPGKDTNPDNVKRVERLLPRSAWDELFPVRHTSFTYENLLKAIAAFPAYCQTYDDGRDSDTICLKLLITSFAHNVQEGGANTPSLTYKGQTHMQDGVHYHPESDAYYKDGDLIPQWRQALWSVREVGYEEDGSKQSPYRVCTPGAVVPCGDANMWALNYQCPAGRDYFGRGSKLLPWNYNYGHFSKLVFNDANYLLGKPELVADSWVNFATAIWFAVTPQYPAPSILEVIDGTWQPNAMDNLNGIKPGFGATINIISLGLECNGGVYHDTQNRIDAYRNFAAYFNVQIPVGEEVECSMQKPFDLEGAGATSRLFWHFNQSTRYKCQVSNYQSAFLISVDTDYAACVDYYYRSRWVDRDTGSVVSQYGDDGPTGRPPVA